MKKILFSWALISMTLTANTQKAELLDELAHKKSKKQKTTQTYTQKEILRYQKMDVSLKKERFYALIAPAVIKTHDELYLRYLDVAKDIQEKQNPERIAELKRIYKVKKDKELLAALKPHPPSVVLAQAALESGWATSRFFLQANNIFGMWSVNPKEPRIAASQKRGSKTIWLKSFDSIEDSVRAYYELLAKGKAYKGFRQLRLQTNNALELTRKLDKYSELGEDYTKELRRVIRHNKLTRYDAKIAY